MWLSLNIISKFVDVTGMDPHDIAHRLTMCTAETESVEFMNPHLKTVIAAKILDVRKHPDADKLTLCDMDTGSEKLRVVCGAPNHKKGDIVPLALVGTKFTEEFTVKKTKIRGQDSSGMLCSEKELGLSDDHSGIMILPPDTRPGTPLSEMYSGWCDVRIEIDNKAITHRPDLWSHEGFAREIAALFRRKLTDPVDMKTASGFKSSTELKVIIESPEACPRYCGLAVKNITIAESPDWLKARVTAIGMRPINNIVDVTNYVMAELGEPMHAFDRKKLRGDSIIVRFARQGETMTTLDGQDHSLSGEDIVIADAGGTIALAGVMGGGNSEIEDDTNEIVLEAANFNPVNIRKTAGRHSLRTEAAIRFEKALDPENCSRAIIRCYDLIKQILPEAEAATPIIDTYPRKFEKIEINTDTDFIRRKLGHFLEDSEITSILTNLTFKVKSSGRNLSIEVPTYRATKDISIPDDIVEEVGRIFGYENIDPTPPMVPCAPPDANARRLLERKIKDILTRNHNMIEVCNYSFVGEDLLNRLGVNEDRELRLRNPLSRDEDRLRRSLIPNIVKNIELNQRYNDYFSIYEMGRAYLKDSRESADLAKESYRVAGAFCARKSEVPLFYEAKSAVMDIFTQLSVGGVRFLPARDGLPAYVHPARAMEVLIGKERAGLIFELHPGTREAFEVRGSAALFDLDFDMILAAPRKERSFRELQKFPDAPFEISVIADRLDYTADICSIIAKSSREHVRSVDVLSIYEGDPVPKGKKSVSIRVVFAAPERTLGTGEIEKLQGKVIEDLDKKGFKLR